MNAYATAAFERFKIERNKLVFSVAKLENSPNDSIERSVIWSTILQTTKSAVAALVRSGMLDSDTKGIAHKIRNFEDADRIFKYMLHARNAEIHADEHFDILPNPVRDAELRIGGNTIVIQGSGTIICENSFLDGVRIQDGVYSLSKDGTFDVPKSARDVRYFPKQIELRPVKDKSGMQYEFPLELVQTSQLPEIFAAKHVISSLDVWEQELVAARKNKLTSGYRS